MASSGPLAYGICFSQLTTYSYLHFDNGAYTVLEISTILCIDDDDPYVIQWR